MLRKYTQYKDTQASQSDNQILTRILEIVIDINIQIKIDRYRYTDRYKDIDNSY